MARVADKSGRFQQASRLLAKPAPALRVLIETPADIEWVLRSPRQIGQNSNINQLIPKCEGANASALWERSAPRDFYRVDGAPSATIPAN